MAELVVARVVEADRDQVCKLTKAVHYEGFFADISFSERKFDQFFHNTLNSPKQHLGLKVSLGNQVVGCCYCQLGGYFIGEGAKLVTVNTICVASEVRSTILGGKVAMRLAAGIDAWAKAQGAQYILYHVTSGARTSNVDRFFRKIGMKMLGGNYGVLFKQ